MPGADGDNIISLHQFRSLLKEELIHAHGERLSNLEDTQKDLDNKIDTMANNLHGFEKRMMACFNEMSATLTKDISSLSKEMELSKRENTHQCAVILNTVESLTFKLKTIDETQQSHTKRINDLERAVETVTKTVKDNDGELQSALTNLNSLITPSSVALLKSLDKEVASVKNIKTAAIVVTTVLLTVLCTIIYAQDAWLKWQDILTRLRKPPAGAAPPAQPTPVTKPNN